MAETKRAKQYRIVSATCFALFCVYSILMSVYNICFNIDGPAYGHSLGWKDIAKWIVYCGIAVLLYSKKKNIGLLIFTGVGAAVSIIGHYLISMRLLLLLAWGSLFVLFLINIVPAMKKYAGKTRILAFITGAFYLIYYIYLAIVSNSWQFLSIVSYVFHIVMSAGMIFAGLWFREFVDVSPTRLNNSVQLQMYTDMLESGVITQEEFETLKEELDRI